MSPSARILVVDDDATIRGILAEALAKTGYETLEATNGSEAEHLARQHEPDLVLLDVAMPGEDGFSVCEHLKSEVSTSDTPVIFITAKTNPAHIERAFSVGGSDYITKPFHMREVRARVCAHLDLHRAVRELEKSQAALLRAQKLEAVGQLAAGVAHEINTPTQFVGDNTRFLQETFSDVVALIETLRGLSSADSPPPSADQLISTIREALDQADVDYLLAQVPRALESSLHGLKRISKIVKAMKQFSHPGSSEKEQANINRAIESTTTVARNEWRYVADLELHLDDSLPPVPCLLGDLNQVILNLIVNAAHAIADVVGDGSQGRGKITITTSQVGGEAEIRIADTGGGIPEAIHSKIFDPFFTTKEVGKGTGQGLAIVHTVITEGHGGSIDVETEVGKGTTFIIRLPLEAAPDRTEAA